MLSLWTMLARRAERTPAKVLLRFADQTWTYAEVVSQALRAGRVFRSLGVGAGDTVCLMLRNSPDHVFAWFGLSRLGAISVPINVHLKGDGLAYLLHHAEARVLLIEADLLPRLAAFDLPPRLQSIIVRGDDSQADRSWATLVHESPADCPGADVRPESIATILYTSGTTGAPKGVMLSHHAYLNSAQWFAEYMVGATSEDVLYTSLPLFHINAQAHTVLPAIHMNATFALGEGFSASRFWDEIRQHGATIFNSLAAMIPILCKQPPRPDDRHHHARLTACAATPKDVWRVFEDRFGVRIIEGYGLTETAGFCVCNPRDAVCVGSIGKPMPWIEAAIVDREDRPLPPGERGEIAIRPRAPHVLMEGYFRMPEQTAAAMRDGWFHSGDLGYADEDGYLYFVDRAKQSIRRRGENISSWEVEKIVNAHPQVLESAAVGVPSELGEEEVMIHVVPRADATIDPLDLIRWCEERMAYFMVPRYVRVRESLPKTATERVEKYKLKAEGSAGAWDREAAGYKLKRT